LITDTLGSQRPFKHSFIHSFRRQQALMHAPHADPFTDCNPRNICSRYIRPNRSTALHALLLLLYTYMKMIV